MLNVRRLGAVVLAAGLLSGAAAGRGSGGDAAGRFAGGPASHRGDQAAECALAALAGGGAAGVGRA